MAGVQIRRETDKRSVLRYVALILDTIFVEFLLLLVIPPGIQIRRPV
jgi:hypothetical protein